MLSEFYCFHPPIQKIKKRGRRQFFVIFTKNYLRPLCRYKYISDFTQFVQLFFIQIPYLLFQQSLQEKPQFFEQKP